MIFDFFLAVQKKFSKREETVDTSKQISSDESVQKSNDCMEGTYMAREAIQAGSGGEIFSEGNGL